MYRLLSCSKDTYICDKIIAGSRSVDANVGHAGTLDLYKLYNETILSGISGSIVEISRLLLKFDYSQLTENIVSDSSFTASISLKDVYGGQITPSNFILSVYPLSKSFDEGRGFDVVSYRDLDTANFLSASTTTTWSISGAGAEGAMDDTDIDIMTVGNLGSGMQSFGSHMTFNRGDEDGLFNVTALVSASIAGILPNYGFRISYTGSQEQDTTTRFVKRFGSRHTFDKSLRPKLIVEYNDKVSDTSGYPYFSVSQSFFTYNQLADNYRNFYSGSTELTGDDCLLLQLISSKSISYTTSSWQPNFSASINHLTTSVLYYSQSFSASQYNSQEGIYACDFILDPVGNSELETFISTSSEIGFDIRWRSLDETVVFAKDFVIFKKLSGIFVNSQEKNYVVNAINLKDEYARDENTRIKVIVQNKTMLQKDYRYPTPSQFTIIPDMRWRLLNSYNGEEIIPFSTSTRLSTDKEGMYFDLYIQDLDVNEVYELEFLIRNEQGKDFIVQNKGFIFKVVS